MSKNDETETINVGFHNQVQKKIYILYIHVSHWGKHWDTRALALRQSFFSKIILSTFSWYNPLFYSVCRRRSTLVLAGTNIPLNPRHRLTMFAILFFRQKNVLLLWTLYIFCSGKWVWFLVHTWLLIINFAKLDYLKDFNLQLFQVPAKCKLAKPKNLIASFYYICSVYYICSDGSC